MRFFSFYHRVDGVVAKGQLESGRPSLDGWGVAASSLGSEVVRRRTLLEFERLGLDVEAIKLNSGLIELEHVGVKLDLRFMKFDFGFFDLDSLFTQLDSGHQNLDSRSIKLDSRFTQLDSGHQDLDSRRILRTVGR
jgi:hypothetical protein